MGVAADHAQQTTDATPIVPSEPAGCNTLKMTRIVGHSFFKAVFLALLSIISQCDAITITGKLRLPESESTLNSTRITLDATRSTYSQIDGSFVFNNVGTGIHLLDIHSLEYHFSHVKIQVLDEGEIKCIEYAYPGAPKRPIEHPLLLTAHAKYDYFEARQGFSIFSIFKNPMMLMMLVSGGLMFMMPKMMEGMDDEQKEQMRKQMEMQQDPTKMMSMLWNDMAGGGEEDNAPAPRISNRGNSAGGTKGSKRRAKRD